jgi:hypothetical protein
MVIPPERGALGEVTREILEGGVSRGACGSLARKRFRNDYHGNPPRAGQLWADYRDIVGKRRNHLENRFPFVRIFQNRFLFAQERTIPLKEMMLARTFLHTIRALLRERDLTTDEKLVARLQKRIDKLRAAMPQKAGGKGLHFKQTCTAARDLRGRERTSFVYEPQVSILRCFFLFVIINSKWFLMQEVALLAGVSHFC